MPIEYCVTRLTPTKLLVEFELRPGYVSKAFRGLEQTLLSLPGAFLRNDIVRKTIGLSVRDGLISLADDRLRSGDSGRWELSPETEKRYRRAGWTPEWGVGPPYARKELPMLEKFGIRPKNPRKFEIRDDGRVITVAPAARIDRYSKLYWFMYGSKRKLGGVQKARPFFGLIHPEDVYSMRRRIKEEVPRILEAQKPYWETQVWSAAFDEMVQVMGG